METAKPKFELTNIELEEGSLVDKGDNPPAKVVFFKGGSASLMDRIRGVVSRFRKGYGYAEPSKNGESEIESMSPRTTAQIMAMNDFNEKFCSLKGAFMQSVHSIMETAPAEDLGDLLKKTVDEFASASAELVKSSNFKRADELKEILAQLNEAVTNADKRDSIAIALEKLEKIDVPETSTKGDGPVVTTNKEKGMDTKTITLEEALKGITDDAAKKVIEAALKAESEKKQSKEAEDTAKKASDDVTKRLEAAEKAAADALAKVAKLEQEKQDSEFVTKARSMPVPGQSYDDVAKVLKAAHGVSKEAGEAMERSFKALSEQAKLNGVIMRSIGKAGGAEGNEITAHEHLVKEAKKLMETDKQLTYERAYSMAMNRNPELAKAAINGEAVTR